MANPEIARSPISGGFLRGGSETVIPLDDWRYKVDFVGGPCEPAKNYPNIQSVCESEEDPENPVVDLERLGEYDPKDVSDTHIVEGFRPWPVYEIEQCAGDDIVRPSDRQRVLDQLANHRSSLFAREFSDGLYSGSPSLRSVGVPVSNTAFGPVRAVAELLAARVSVGVAGPHIIVVPLEFRPYFENVDLVSNEDYRIVYDTFAKSYIPDEDIVGGGEATAPGSGQGWIGIVGNYEYGWSDIVLDDTATIEGKTGNVKAVMGEQQLFYRFDTCGVFLAKVAVFGS